MLVAAACALAGSPCHAADAPRPNMVVILVDDLRWDDIGCMGHPFSRTPHADRIAREGARFLNAFAVTPLCSPSRASFLTGLYTHAHGIIDNTERGPQTHKLPTFPQALQRAGYETAFIGKWHMGNDHSPRPGFDYWACLKGQGTSNDPELNINGKPAKFTGYTTDVLSTRAVDFLKRPHSKPFLLYLAHKALHPEVQQLADGSLSGGAAKFIPAARHKNLYTGATVPRRPNALKPPENKPALQRQIGGLPPLGPATGSPDDTILDRLRMLAAVDDSTGDILRALEQTRQLDNTLVIFTSDHGYWYGEHGLSVERRLAYEEGIRIPLLMRLPRLAKAGSTPAEMSLSIDLAPTLVELAGAPVPANLPGRSLVPVLKGQAKNWRKSFLIEYYSDIVFPRIPHMGYKAIRTDRYLYIGYTELEDMDELYDLQSDPYEMKNLIDDEATEKTVIDLKAQMAALLDDSAQRQATRSKP
ncbi:MAG: sulfatase [Verrucomicrobiota bacterium]